MKKVLSLTKQNKQAAALPRKGKGQQCPHGSAPIRGSPFQIPDSKHHQDLFPSWYL